MAIKEAKGNVIIRMDVHTIYADEYIKACIDTLLATGAQNVGGAARTIAKGYVQGANAIAFGSVFSVGGASFHSVDYEGWVDTVTYGCWWKETLLDIGLFDEKLIRNQDDELNYRIKKNGGRIWQSSRIKSWYFPRATISGIFNQYMQYGYWKVGILKKHKLPSSWRQLVPPIFLASLLVSGLCAINSNISFVVFSAVMAAYLAVSLIFSWYCCVKRGNKRYFIIMPIVFMAYHFGYGVGYMLGLLVWMFPRISYYSAMAKINR